MARHFWQLYLLIVITLVGASWVQDQLTQLSIANTSTTQPIDPAQRAVLALVTSQLQGVAPDARERALAALAATTQTNLSLFALQDIAGPAILQRLTSGEPASMQADDRTAWLLQRIDSSDQVVAVKFDTSPSRRSTAEWLLTLAFYAAIALVIMTWLWPLTRDLRKLERSTMAFGDRNWKFDASISARSQIHTLAEAFKRMAARIDGLIGSHKDMTNAMSHEIKTPLARMRFEVEMARGATSREQFNEHLDHINSDIAELNSFVTATLDYAILERAEVALNVGEHDLTQVLPALAVAAQRSCGRAIGVAAEVAPSAQAVRCDIHLLETVVRNLLYNAARYANHQVKVSFDVERGNDYVLRVDDDGPGIAPADRTRVFESFVQLDQPATTKTGFGLGLAIVNRIVEWHRGTVAVTESPLGGARFVVKWQRSGM